MQENRSRAVSLLGERGRRTRKKDKHRKGPECRDPLHENQSVCNRFGYSRTTEPFLSRFYRLGALTGGGFDTGALTTTGSVVDYANRILERHLAPGAGLQSSRPS